MGGGGVRAGHYDNFFLNKKIPTAIKLEGGGKVFFCNFPFPPPVYSKILNFFIIRTSLLLFHPFAS